MVGPGVDTPLEPLCDVHIVNVGAMSMIAFLVDTRIAMFIYFCDKTSHGV